MSGKGMSLGAGGPATKVNENQMTNPTDNQRADNAPNEEPEVQTHLDDVDVPRPPSVNQDGVPVCPLHNCPMHAGSTHPEKKGNGATTYYRCQVPDCKETGKLIRPSTSVFRKPMECPSRLCQEKKKKSKKVPYLVKDPRKISGSHVMMRCPDCEFSVPVPNPVFGTKPPRTNPPPEYGAR